jgi:hypothetical protein
VESRPGLALQLRGGDDPGSALRDLRAVRRAIEGSMAEASAVSPVVPAPGGPIVVVTPLPGAGTIQPDAVLSLAESQLANAGPQAHLAPLELGGDLDELDHTPNAATLRLFAAPDRPLTPVSPTWVDAALHWALADVAADDRLRVRLLGVEFDVEATRTAEVLRDALEARAWCDLVQGDLTSEIRVVSLTFGPLPHLAVAGGGPGADDRALLDVFSSLQALAREVAPTVAWACARFDPDFGRLATGLSPLDQTEAGWPDQHLAPPNAVAAALVDRRIPGIYPYQVLSARHVEALGAPPEQAEPLPGGRWEVTAGTPEAWLDGEPIEIRALADLSPLLVPADSVGSATIDDNEASSADAGPSLDAVVIEPSPHRHRTDRVTILELVGWLDGQPHSNEPDHVSVPLGSFARWLGVGLDSVRRQRLRRLAAPLVQSAAAPGTEQRRAWAITRWFVAVQAGSWLRQIGAGDVVDALGGDDLSTATGLASATARLARVALDCQRVLDAHPQRDLAWDVWDAISGPSGWDAAAQAAVADVAPDVTAAAEQRMVEVVRGQGRSAPIDAAALANEVWSVTLGALADHLWIEGWKSADAVASAAANTDLLGPALGTSADIWDALDDADRADATSAAHDAARGPLARVGLDVAEATEQHPWDLAVDSAHAAPGATAWAARLELARSQAGEDVWHQAMAAARRRVDALGETAPDLVARTRLVAAAREAAAAAARLAAAEELALSLEAQPEQSLEVGPARDKVVPAAIAGLSPVTDQLGRSALGLLDRMLRGRSPARRRAVRRREV